MYARSAAISRSEMWRAKVVVLGDHDLVAPRPCDRVRGIGLDLERTKRLLERVEAEDATNERLADADDDLDRLERLQRTDDAGQNAKDARLRARRGQIRGRWLGHHVPVVRSAQRIEHRDHALEAEDRAVH